MLVIIGRDWHGQLNAVRRIAGPIHERTIIREPAMRRLLRAIGLLARDET
jgi:hypothetical protein